VKPALTLTTALALLAGSSVYLTTARISTVLAAETPSVTLDVQGAAPRQVEDATQRAIARDYAAAWQAMSEALDQNRPDLLATNFIGTASDKLTETIQQQKKTGIHRRYVDNGHHVQAVFYSAEGSAIELHDSATMQIQVLDGGKVVASQNVTTQYVVLMTAAENSWKVRVLQEIPSL